MLELKDALQQQLSEARNQLSQAETQLADSRKESEALAAKVKTAEEAKTEAEKVGEDVVQAGRVGYVVYVSVWELRGVAVASRRGRCRAGS